MSDKLLCTRDDTPMQDLGDNRYRCPRCGIEMYLSEEYKKKMIERSNKFIVKPPSNKNKKSIV